MKNKNYLLLRSRNYWIIFISLYIFSFILAFIIKDFTINYVVVMGNLLYFFNMKGEIKKVKKKEIIYQKIYKKRFIVLGSIFLIIIVLIGSVYIYNIIKYPNEVHYAWESVNLACGAISNLIANGNFSSETAKDAGAGGFYNPLNKSITILYDKNDSFYEKAYKHELCHSKQILPNSCYLKEIFFMHELKCYKVMEINWSMYR